MNNALLMLNNDNTVIREAHSSPSGCTIERHVSGQYLNKWHEELDGKFGNKLKDLIVSKSVDDELVTKYLLEVVRLPPPISLFSSSCL